MNSEVCSTVAGDAKRLYRFNLLSNAARMLRSVPILVQRIPFGIDNGKENSGLIIPQLLFSVLNVQDQFPIEMSLPWILTDHILETKEPSMME